MYERKKNPSKTEIVMMMNERGLRAWDGVIITCAETGETWSVERIGPSEDVHAEIGPDGNVMFVIHDEDDRIEPKSLH